MADKTYINIIESGNKLIKEVVDFHLIRVKKYYDDQIFFTYDILNEDEKYLATNNLEIPSGIVKDFQNDMKQAFAEISSYSIESAMKEVKLNRVTLAEPKNLFKNSKLNKLNSIPSSIRKRIEKQSEVFTNAIVVDYTKDVMVVFDQNWQMNKKDIEKILDQSYLTFISGKKIENGIESQSAQIVNENRNAVFTSHEAQEQELVFEFWNPNDESTSALCRFLNGTIFTADDPLFETYTCPLHFNCRSTFLPRVNYQGEIGGLPALKELPPEARKVLQF